MNPTINKILDEHNERLKKLEEKVFGNKDLKPIIQEESLGLQEEIEIFCKKSGIEQEKIRKIIDFQEKFPRLMNLPKEKTRTKIQKKSLIILSLIVVRIYKLSLNEGLVRNLFELSRIPTERMDKLYSSNLFKKYFSKSGVNIKLSWAGEKEAEKMLLEKIKNEA